MLRPTIRGIVIIVIIIVMGKAQTVFHHVGIIAQDYLSSADSFGSAGL
jgi:hypothetical protein